MTIRVSAIKLVMDNCWDMAADIVGDYKDGCEDNIDDTLRAI